MPPEGGNVHCEFSFLEALDYLSLSQSQKRNVFGEGGKEGPWLRAREAMPEHPKAGRLIAMRHGHLDSGQLHVGIGWTYTSPMRPGRGRWAVSGLAVRTVKDGYGLRDFSDRRRR